jgi:hypothetical protein
MATTRRGGIVELPRRTGAFALEGATRVEMRLGLSGKGGSVVATSHETAVRGGQFVVSAAHWVREDLALELGFRGSDFEASEKDLEPKTAPAQGGAPTPVTTPLGGKETTTTGAFALLFGARYYVPRVGSDSPLRPYATAAIGPCSTFRVHTLGTQGQDVSAGATRLGGYAGGGIDFLVKRFLVVGAYGGVMLRRGGDPSVGFGLTLGCAFGGTPRPLQ